MRGTVAGVVVLALATAGGVAAHKQPAASSGPTAGICLPASGKIVTVDVTPDVPSPRCTTVRPGQELRVRNDTRDPVEVRWAPFRKQRLQPGHVVTYGVPFARYLQPGDHRCRVSIYAGGGFEIYLPSHRRSHAAPTSAG